MLATKGCGTRFRKAVGRSLSVSTGIIGSESFSATAGVKQGGCTSCPMFCFYVDPTIEAVKECGPDGWLTGPHLLLFMDDTAIFATSREMLERKLRALKQCTDQIGMEIHPTKSKFLCINASTKEPIIMDNITVGYTERYIYLGTPILNASIPDQVRVHIDLKKSHTVKFSSFLAKNRDAPFHVKKKVWDSALMTAIFYSSETWLSDNFRAVEGPYMSTLKQLLGVRLSTCNDLVLVEAGVGDAKSVIQAKQCRYLKKLTSRQDYQGSYLEQVIAQAIALKTPMGAVLNRMINLSAADQVDLRLCRLRDGIRSSDSSRRQTYLEMNTDFSPSIIYSPRSTVPEYARMAATRIRLSSHYLRIETGRWSRLDRENRLCPCGVVQTEEHVLLQCPLTAGLRSNCPLLGTCVSIRDLFNFKDLDPQDVVSICRHCYHVLQYFK